jgi:antiviral helicase SKI2
MEVHKMQVILSEKGYDSGEEDMEYWYFGSTTVNALMTFQASERLRETGITDIDTWRALLGEDRLAMAPADALATIGDGEYPNDLARTDKVFLLGEQRYEN